MKFNKTLKSNDIVVAIDQILWKMEDIFESYMEGYSVRSSSLVAKGVKLIPLRSRCNTSVFVNILRTTISILILIFTFTGCKKVIHINLNATSPRYVVEGNITNGWGPYAVTISKTVNFDLDNIFPAVSGALVVVTDLSAHQTDTLIEAHPGYYQTHIISGIPGHTYCLYIQDSGNVFTATSTMPQPVTLDSLYTQLSIFGKNIEVVPVYTDPVLVGRHYNYYYFLEYINNQVSSRVIAREDDLINGQVIKLPIRGDKIITGDSVVVEMECIDSNVYTYYETLSLTQNSNSATPANPQSNISGSALGYFSAHTISVRGVVAQ